MFPLEELLWGLSRCEPVRTLGRFPFGSGQIAAALPPYQFAPRSGPSSLTDQFSALLMDRTLKTEQRSFQCFASVSAHFLQRSSPRLISTGQLHASQRFHLRPIDDVVYIEPYSSRDERSNLRESFTLRCLQRLSRPNVATQLCPWRDNWCTSGSSIPVLSY